jgi:hypothetical protein
MRVAMKPALPETNTPRIEVGIFRGLDALAPAPECDILQVATLASPLEVS